MKGRQPTTRPHLPVFSLQSIAPVIDHTTGLAIEKSPMNKGETEYAVVLEKMRQAGVLWAWVFQGVKLRLGSGAWYTPDFLLCGPTGLAIHESKGRWAEAARVRIKTAAGLYPYFQFVAVQKDRLGYKYEIIKSHHSLVEAHPASPR